MSSIRNSSVRRLCFLTSAKCPIPKHCPFEQPFYIQSETQWLTRASGNPRLILLHCLSCVNVLRVNSSDGFYAIIARGRISSHRCVWISNDPKHMQSKIDTPNTLLCHSRNQWTLCVLNAHAASDGGSKAQHGVPSAPSWFSLFWPPTTCAHVRVSASTGRTIFERQDVSSNDSVIRFKYVWVAFAPFPFRYTAHALARFSNYNAYVHSMDIVDRFLLSFFFVLRRIIVKW